MSDAVDHPSHYNAHPSGVEAIDVCEWLPFNLGNALKYVWRAKHKGNRAIDLAKARWYLTRATDSVIAYSVPPNVQKLAERVIALEPENSLLGSLLKLLVVDSSDSLSAASRGKLRVEIVMLGLVNDAR